MAAQRPELLGPVNATVREHVIFRLSVTMAKTYWTGRGWGKRTKAHRFANRPEAQDKANELQAQPEADGHTILSWTDHVYVSDREPTREHLEAVAKRMFVNGQGGGEYPGWQLKQVRDAWLAVVEAMQE